MTAKKTPVENRDLWEQLLEYTEKHEVSFYRVKGHISLGGNVSAASLKKVFAKFTEWNGPSFSYDDFLHVTEMNNLADELANKGISSLRSP
jgi:ribonuclease HI